MWRLRAAVHHNPSSFPMTSRDEKISFYLGALEELPELWRSLDVRTIAINTGGEWHNSLTNVRIDTRLPDELPALESLPETELIGCWQERLAAAELPSLIEDILAGARVIAGRRVVFLELTEANAVNGKPYSDATLALENRRRAVSPAHRPRDYVAHYLDLRSSRYGPPVSSTVFGGDQALRRSLESAEQPWEGLAGLARVALESPTKPDEQAQPLVEFIAPLGIAFENDLVALRDGELTVGLWAGSRAAALRASVGYIAEGEDRSYQVGSLRVEATSWEGNSEQRGRKSVSLGATIKRVTLLGRLGSSVVDRRTCEDVSRGSENVHLAVYKELDEGLARLKKALIVSDRNAREHSDAAAQFEHAVARIFSIAGFHSDALGSARGVQQAFDVLARTPDGATVIALECSVGALNTKDGKPNRLLGRVDDLRRAPGLVGCEIIPVMATSRHRTSLSKLDLGSASSDRIGVFCQEDLLELLESVDRGASISEVVERCRRAIPANALASTPLAHFLTPQTHWRTDG